MKVKNYYYLIPLLIILLFSVNICLAQDSTTVRIRKNGNPVALTDSLVEEDGKKVLVINKNETIEFFLEDGVKLESKNTNSVAVLNGYILVGVTINTQSEITAKKGDTALKIKDVENLIVKVKDADATRQIIAQSTFLSYKTVKDNFGKKFAQSYFVIQVDIRNETLNKQFIVQTLDVIIDPNQCWNGRFLYEGFDYKGCLATYNEYFLFSVAQQPVRREEVIASGKADLNRSNRNVGFRIVAFLSSIGSVLTGFNGVLGPDGVKGMNVLGTTVTSAANGLFPNNADEKLENLKNAIPTDDVIIKSKESKTFNIFIPTERLFYKKSWERYIRPAKDSSKETYTLKAVLDLLLLSSATGVLVDNDAPKVQVKSDDNLRKQAEKFGLVGIFSDEETKRTDNFFDTVKKLESDLGKPAPSSDRAVQKLRIIVGKLLEVPRFKTFLGAETITVQSDGGKILSGIKALSRSLNTQNIDNALIKQFEEIIIQNGN